MGLFEWFSEEGRGEQLCKSMEMDGGWMGFFWSFSFFGFVFVIITSNHHIREDEIREDSDEKERQTDGRKQ